jgi:Restriction endonuclease
MVAQVDFASAFYIKLGRAGEWEADSIANCKLRLGWKHQSIDDINGGNWELIENQLRAAIPEKQHAGTVTADFNALKHIACSSTNDVWITFHMSKLWWTRLTGPVKQDDISKFRDTSQPWNDKDAEGKLLIVNDLPGKIAQIQAFRAACCRVKSLDLLKRTLNGTPSPLAADIRDQRAILASKLAQAIQELHWKDFETLVDLVFRAAGWIRVSVLGQQAKAFDLELREPILGERYVVQVKSRARLADLKETIANFSPESFRRIFFVVHSPDTDLIEAAKPDHVEIVLPERLGELAMEAGLARWIENKAY